MGSWEIFADESGSLIFERHRQGLSSYRCLPAELLNGRPVRGSFPVPAIGLPDGIHVTRWAVV